VTSPIDIVFSEYDVLQPDVIFFSCWLRTQLTATGQDAVAPAVLPGQTLVAASLFPRR